MRFKCEDTAESIIQMREYIDLLEHCVRAYRDLVEDMYPVSKKHRRKAGLAISGRYVVEAFAEKLDREARNA